MAEFGELDQQLGGIGAGEMQLRRQFERRRDLAGHGVGEEVDDLAAIGEAEHRAQVGGFDLARRAVGDRLVEQRQRVAHRAFGDAGDQRQRVGLGRHALEAADLLEMAHHQRRSRCA